MRALDVMSFKDADGTGNGAAIKKIMFNGLSIIFTEHFPGMPILPGAFSTVLAIREIQNYILKSHGIKSTINEVAKVRFLKKISPEKEVVLNIINYKESRNSVRIQFAICELNEVCVDGLLIYGVIL